MDWQYPYDRTVQLQRCTPHSSRWCCSHISWRCCPRVSWQCNSVVCQVLANAVHIHVDLVPICSKICEVLAVQPARATLSMQLARVSTLPRQQEFTSPISGTASRRCSDGVSHTRLDVASPACATVHSIASIVEPGLSGGPTLGLLRTLGQAEFTFPSPSWRLTEDRSCSSSLLHCLPSSDDGIPRTCCCGATRQHL